MLICAATGLTPFPESETVVGDAGAVIGASRVTGFQPCAAPLKLTLTRAVCPGVRTAGSVVADARRNAGELEVIALMVRFAVDGYCTGTDFSPRLIPTVGFRMQKAGGVTLVCAAKG